MHTAVTLPNQKRVFGLNSYEPPIIYQHVRGYFKADIRVQPGDVIFDVGANIGLFAMEAWERARPNGQVFAFEPVPEIFRLLKTNIEQHGCAGVKMFPCAVSHSTGYTELTFIPRLGMASTAYPSGWGAEIKDIVSRNIEETPGFLRWSRFVPLGLRRLLLDVAGLYFLKQEQVVAETTTLSAFIAANEIKQISLLKIDVEKSELDVLMGVRDEHWPRIMQVVAEIHDFDDRVRQIAGMLSDRGFTQVKVEQEPGYSDTNIFNVYGSRHGRCRR